MDYLGIIKRAYTITFKRKYLWIFGLLAGGALGGSSFNFSMPNGTISEKEWSSFIGNNSIDNIFTNYWGVIVAIIGFLVLLGLILAVLSIIFEGGLLGSVRAIEKNEKNDFRSGFIFGWHKFWRVFTVGLLVGLIIFGSIIILAVPIVLFVIAKSYILAVIYGLLVFLLDLILWIYIGFVYPYIMRMAVLDDKGSAESISISWEFFKLHWKEILIMYLLMMAIGFVVMIAYILGILIVGGILFAIGLAIFLASKIACIIYACVATLVFIILIFIIRGIINTFTSSVYTLTYLELASKKA